MVTLFTTILQRMEQGAESVLCTVIDGSGSIPRGKGAQMLVGRTGLLCGTIGGGSVEGQAITLCQDVMEHRENIIHAYQLRHNDQKDIGMVCGGNVTVLFQYIDPCNSSWIELSRNVLRHLAQRQDAQLILPLDGTVPYFMSPHAAVPPVCCALPLPIGERAILFGAGHCSAALSPILQTIGFRVTVMDNRAELANSDRFPGADVVICGDFDRISDYLTVTEEDYIVVMTSGHSYDLSVESQILRGNYAYIGVIGSRSKTAAVNARLREIGIDEAAIASVHTPIGTAIKAVTPEEIAVSIAGEMILVRAERRAQQSQLPHSCPMHE